MENPINKRDLINKTDMNIVIVGHVDHGKSTVIGRLWLIHILCR